MFEIKRYTPADEAAWNDFTARSRQGTFLLDRRYMDYHADRFEDFSLMVYHKNRLYALLPANRMADGTLCSHGGLTYGGLLTDEKATAGGVCDLFALLNGRLREWGIGRVVYKAIPWIYHRRPAEEDLYALANVCHARLAARDIASVVRLDNRLRLSTLRRTGVRKAMKQHGITIAEGDDTDTFWNILNDNLHHKYNVSPVHSAPELRLLKARFPDRIRLYMAFQEDNVLAGALLFLCGETVHVQYISASPEGKRLHALDLLFSRLIEEAAVGHRYFDFGKSTEDCGHYLNRNLIFQKEGFGGRGVCYDWYEWNP